MKKIFFAMLLMILSLALTSTIHAQTSQETTTKVISASTPANQVDIPANQVTTSTETTTTGKPEQPKSVFNVLTDPNNITFLTFIAANMADAKTAWQFSLGGKQYTITPLQRMEIALGGAAAALYIREQFPDKPRLKKAITVGMGVATAYFAGKALANTYNHGSQTVLPPAVAVAATRTPSLAFAIKLH